MALLARFSSAPTGPDGDHIALTGFQQEGAFHRTAGTTPTRRAVCDVRAAATAPAGDREVLHLEAVQVSRDHQLSALLEDVDHVLPDDADLAAGDRRVRRPGGEDAQPSDDENQHEQAADPRPSGRPRCPAVS